MVERKGLIGGKKWKKHGWMKIIWGFGDWRLKLGPSEQDSVEFGPDHLQQLRVEKVLTQAEGAPVTSAHAAQSGVAAEENGTENTSALLITSCFNSSNLQTETHHVWSREGFLMRRLRRNNSAPSEAGTHQKRKYGHASPSGLINI